MIRALLLTFLLLAGCATERDLPTFAERIIDTRTRNPIARDELVRRLAAARFVILGEIHDNARHHRLQAELLETMLAAGRRPAIAMEQFDRENQAALDAARARGERDPERLADAGKFDRKGWRWHDYEPIVRMAAANDLPLLAANFSRADARALMKSGVPAPGIAPAGGAERTALEKAIVDGHCGIRPPPAMLSGMVEVQRARDARMAEVLGAQGTGAAGAGAVLVAGAGHARLDRGVPSYMPPEFREQLLSVGLVEFNSDGTLPVVDYRGIYDVVWFTPRAAREDPCLNLKMQGAR